MILSHDLNAMGPLLPPLRGGERKPDGPGPDVHEAAKQFEGILIRQMLAPLEKSLTAGSGSGGNVPMVGGMVMESLSQSIVSGGGLGLADMVEAALRGRASTPPDSEKK